MYQEFGVLVFYSLFSALMFYLAKTIPHPINPAPYPYDILSMLKVLATTIIIIPITM